MATSQLQIGGRSFGFVGTEGEQQTLLLRADTFRFAEGKQNSV